MTTEPSTPENLVNVRGTQLLATDTREQYRQKLARITLDSMVQFVGLLDAKGTVLETNHVALDAVGIKLSEVEGKPFWTTFWRQVSEEINATLRESIRRASLGEFVRWDAEIYGRASGKETIIIDASLMPVKDEHGAVVFITAEGRDITEKKANEREIARQREELAKLDVLKTQFFANISHEFRTPLTVIMNLVINAAESVGAGASAVELKTHLQVVGEEELAANVTRQTASAGEYAVLTVTDTGCGMDASIRSRIFDPFFTTKFTGRSLGLSSVMGIVRGHKGLLTVESQPGAGTTFRVFLPVAARSVRSQPVYGESALGEGTVLVVDDEEIVRKIAQAALSRLGYRILTAHNGAEALRIYSSAPGAVDVVLLDMTMPVMGGEETLQHLVETRPDVVVVAMSGFDEREAKSRFGSGIAAFLQKPFTAGQLGSTVGAVRRTRKAR